jgi:NAD(P)-dependent dehydrogenase (short-subunit alcohol dehydrogenase family)
MSSVPAAGSASGTGLFDLTGRVAAVVGGAGVLGGTVCHGFGDAGASIAILDRSPERSDELVAALTAKGVRAAAFVLDASDRASVEAAQKAVEAALGSVDILVNAVGINSGTAMVDRGQGGSIINFSSTSSEVPLSRVLTYSVSKAGINILTRYLARELAPHKVRVNAIVPGFFPAEQNRKLLDDARIESILRHTPMGRLGEADELVGTMIWLASDRASGFVTGALVRVDGGFSAMTI